MRGAMRVLLTLAATAWFVLVQSAAAAVPAVSPEGRWIVRASGTPMTLLILERTEKRLTGTVTRPKILHLRSGQVFTEVEGPTITEKIEKIVEHNGVLELIRAPDKLGQAATILTFQIDSDGNAKLGWKDVPIDPVRATRALPGETLPASWDKTKTYVGEAVYTRSAELAAMFEADQADRRAGLSIDWTVVAPRDEARRARVQQLLDGGKLSSGDDYFHAAFIFQHGGKPESYLKAHSLAVIAVARGRPDATWIAAATLDRYLQSIGQKQIFGTQYSVPNDKPATQEPYDRMLLPDPMRAAVGVEPIAEQEKRRVQYDIDKAAKK